MRRAHLYVREWMRQAGITVMRDNIGNLHGRYEGTGNTTLLLGSHLDSVRDAGKYDGPLGVMVAIAAVHRLHDEARRLPFAIEILAFADEEGLRYGSTYLGSHAGTVPMDRRKDALTAGAELVLAVEAAATTQPGLVATVGRLEVEPGVSNVIPGRATLSLDVRHADDRIRTAACEALLARAREL